MEQCIDLRGLRIHVSQRRSAKKNSGRIGEDVNGATTTPGDNATTSVHRMFFHNQSPVHACRTALYGHENNKATVRRLDMFTGSCARLRCFASLKSAG
jgi:hypothetical protein